MSTNAPSQPAFFSDPLWRQAQGYLAHRQVLSARAVLASMRARQSAGEVAPHLLDAQICWQEGRVRDGAAAALAAAAAVPDDAATICVVAGMLLDAGETLAARECLAHPAVAAATDLGVLMQASTLEKRLDQHVESMALADRAATLGFSDPPFRFLRGCTLLFNGRFEEAEQELAASLAAAPERGQVAVPLVQGRRQTPEHNYLAAIESGMAKAPPGSIDQGAFEFARYKTLEDLGRDDEAWQALAHGNAIMHRHLQHRPRPNDAWVDRFLATWPLPRATARHDGPLPIFVIGIPRSGTTLLERMLGNHSQVADAGELMDLASQLYWVADTRNLVSPQLLECLPRLDYAKLAERYLRQTQWRAEGKRYFIDKRPLNWMFAGIIRSAFPEAPMLNLVRDPMDVCFSNWRAFFGDIGEYSYDMGELARYFLRYQRAIDRWHELLPGAILDVSYADLVRDPEATLRKVFDFCRLEWEPGCADLARNRAPSATMSASQVRSSVYTDRFGQWRRYERQLAPLRAALQASD